MSKYSYELKIKVVNEYLNGENSMTSLAKKYSISSKSIVFNWINTYEQYGFEGLRHKTSKQIYTGDFKLRVIQYRQINRLSYRETANYFKINRGSTIANWERVYNEQGMIGLDRAVGRPSEMSEKKVINNVVMKETEKEELIRLREENEFLRMSLEYEKKLSTLIQEKERRAKKRRK